MADLGTQAEPLGTKASVEERGRMVCCLVLETIPVAAKFSFNVANHLLFCIQKNSLIFYKNLKANWQ
jgi:hypothetical protein